LEAANERSTVVALPELFPSKNEAKFFSFPTPAGIPARFRPKAILQSSMCWVLQLREPV
jgi:hypothetical protein